MGMPFPVQPIGCHHAASFLAISTAGVPSIFGTNNYSKPTDTHRERTAFFLYVPTRPRLKVRLWRDCSTLNYAAIVGNVSKLVPVAPPPDTPARRRLACLLRKPGFFVRGVQCETHCEIFLQNANRLLNLHQVEYRQCVNL